MQKRLWLLSLVLLMLCVLPVCHAETRVMAVSDLHFTSPDLYEGSSLLENSLRRGDGKISHHSRELMDGLVAEVLHQQPDVFVITGDLSLSGERDALTYVAKRLADIADAGIPVCVIPGNHDINSHMCYDWSGESPTPTGAVDPDQFRALFGRFMPADEAERGPRMSYMYRVNDNVCLLMMDACLYEQSGASYGELGDEGLAFAESMLQAADADGCAVICCTHQSLFAHSAFRSDQFEVSDGSRLAAMMAEHGVYLNLSGHAHPQHILTKNGVTDVATEAFCMSPHQYTLITVHDDGSMECDTQPVCAEHWPQDFAEQSRTFFVTAAQSKQFVRITELIPDTAQAWQVIELLADINTAYFSGTLTDRKAAFLSSEGWQLMAAADPQGSYTAYFRTVMDECERDMLHCEIPAPKR